MVDIFGYSVSNSYIGIGIAAVIAIGAIWYFLKRNTGRIAEERQEVKETDQLKKDEVAAEAAEIDEKKQCKILDYNFSDIIIILRKSGMGETAEKLMESRMQISSILNSLGTEKMSVRKALNTFKELHLLINEFLSHLPNNNPDITKLVAEINSHQQRYYQDIIKEVQMDEEKKKLLQKLWTQVLNEEGQLQAA